MLGLKYSNQVRTALPETNVYEIYADMRSFGKGCEELYEETARRGVMFLNFDQREGIPQITKGNPDDCCEMLIEMKERLSNTNIEVPADMVVLLVGMEAHDDAKEVAHHVGVSKCGNDFFIERAVNFFTKSADSRFNNICLRIKIIFPHMFHNHCFRYYSALVLY